MPQYSLSSEIWRLVIILAIALAVGLLLGYPLTLLIIGTSLYIGHHLRHLHQLLQWLNGRRLDEVPDASGLWGQAFDLLSRNKRREVREKNRLKAVIDQVNATTAALKDGVILLNADNSLNWWNQATESLLDLKSGDSGNSIINYIRHPLFVNYLESGDYHLPLTLASPRSPDVQLEFQITRFGKGEAIMVVRNITRLYKLEQMRKDFVANVSHELRTPLTVIRGYLETFEDSPDPHLQANPHWQKALQQMQQQCRRMTTLINDLTMLSKLETDRIDTDHKPVPLKPLLEMICNEARALVKHKQQSIELNCDPSLNLLGNDRELHSAFSNLITNAIKYSPEGTPVNVTAELEDDGKLRLAVIDQGIGVEPEHISRLTERFYRVDASRSIQTGGTGLGLAIVKHILLRHDARLHIESHYGKGSRFSCLFPAERVITVN